MRSHGAWPIVSGVTFMSGTKHSDTHVEYVLDTETWLGPYGETPFARVQEIGALIEASGLKVEVLPDLRPGAVVEAHLQRNRQLGRRAHGAPPRSPLRRRGEPGRSRQPRPRARRRGQGGCRRRRNRAPRRPVGDERARDEARLGALSLDARGRRRPSADRDRTNHRGARPRGRAPRRPGSVAYSDVRPRQGEGGVLAGLTVRSTWLTPKEA